MSEGLRGDPDVCRGAIELGSGRRFLDDCRRGSARGVGNRSDRVSAGR